MAFRHSRRPKGEEVVLSKINSGLFTAMLEAGDVMGVFAGHDHDNDYVGACMVFRLVWTCYGMEYVWRAGAGRKESLRSSKGSVNSFLDHIGRWACLVTALIQTDFRSLENEAANKPVPLIGLAWPIFVGMLAQNIIYTIDTLMLSRYSDRAVAAIGTVSQILGTANFSSALLM